MKYRPNWTPPPRLWPRLLVVLATVLATALLACAPVAPPAEPAAAPTLGATQPGMASTPTPTPTPEPTAHDAAPPAEHEAEPPAGHEADEGDHQDADVEVDADADEPGPTPTLRPHKPPLPDKPLGIEQPHPDGFEACKDITLFGEGDLYQGWCGEQLLWHVNDQCSALPTTDEQRQCGETIAAEYKSFLFLLGPAKCGGIEDASEASACSRATFEDMSKGFTRLFEAGDKVRIVGNRDPAVIEAMDEVVACLGDKGFEKVNEDFLFTWQATGSPADYEKQRDALSSEDRKLIADLREPSRDCAKERGFFAAQDVAWTAELRRLSKDEPEVVADIIREGLLEALEKPGVPAFLTGDDARGSSD